MALHGRESSPRWLGSDTKTEAVATALSWIFGNTRISGAIGPSAIQKPFAAACVEQFRQSLEPLEVVQGELDKFPGELAAMTRTDRRPGRLFGFALWASMTPQTSGRRFFER